MSKEIKFPFEPNERVKAAFRQEAQTTRAVTLMTEAITKIASNILDPWTILKQEHPELIESESQLKYNCLSELVDISPWKPRKFE